MSLTKGEGVSRFRLTPSAFLRERGGDQPAGAGSAPSKMRS
jgi:hypothetical protein